MCNKVKAFFCCVLLGALSVQAADSNFAFESKITGEDDYYIRTADNRYICYSSDRGFFIDAYINRTPFKMLKNEDGTVALNFEGNRFIGAHKWSQEVYASYNRLDWEAFSIEQRHDEKYYLKTHDGKFILPHLHENTLKLSTVKGNWEALDFVDSQDEAWVSHENADQLFERVHVKALWSRGISGRGINVAVFDEGINFAVSGLGEHSSIPGGGMVMEDGSIIEIQPNLYSSGEHGTHMARVLMGSLDNHERRRGIAPDVKILPMEGDFFIPFADSASIIAAEKDIKIATLSKEGVLFSTVCTDLKKKFQEIMLVIIAGNQESNRDNHLMTELNDDLPDEDLTKVDLFKKVIITVALDFDNKLTGDSRQCGNKLAPYCVAVPASKETSPTAPVVAGIVALLMEEFPGRPIHDYQQAILLTAMPLEDADPNTGFGPLTGRGLVNAERASQFLKDSIIK